MKTHDDIHNLDTLEKEIYRLQLSADNAAKQLGRDMDHFRDNFFLLCRNTIKEAGKKERSSLFEQVVQNEHVRKLVSGVTERVTNHLEKSVSDLVDRWFKKKH